MNTLMNGAPKINGLQPMPGVGGLPPLLPNKQNRGPNPMNGVAGRFEVGPKLDPSIKRDTDKKINNSKINNKENTKRKISKYLEENKDKLYVLMFVILKVIAILMTYLALYVTTNYMSNAYINDTIIDGKEPPKLTTYAVLFMLINIGLNSLTLLSVMILTYVANLEIDLISLIFELMGFILVSGMLAYILCLTMENRKYFLYEDDGLRAFRALQTMILYQSIIVVLVPYSKLLEMINIKSDKSE